MRAIPISLLLILCGCLANNSLGTSSRADLNIYHIDKVHTGMTDEQVFQVMSYPDKQAYFATDEGEYVVWYYVIRSTVMDQSRLTPRNLTPLVFKDGVMVGRGYDYVNWVAEKQRNRGAETHVPGPAQAPENVPIERALIPAQKKQGQTQPIQPPPPVQPQPGQTNNNPNQQPGTGPAKQPQMKSPKGQTTMSRPPAKQPEPASSDDDEESPGESEKRKGPPPFNKEEKRMQREEEEEDFDYW